MERIELFDKYIQGALSDAQQSEFDQRLKTDADFASEFKVYLLTVDGICREARQDDMDFGMAMKRLSKEELSEIIGKGPKAISREDITQRLRSAISTNNCNRQELSGFAALENVEDDDFYEDNTEDESTSKPKETGKSTNNSLRSLTVVFIAIVILLILISLFLST